MKQFLMTLAAFAFLAIPAAQAENKSLGVHAKNFYAFATSEKQKNGAVFGTLKNVSREDVAITEASGDIAENIELHTMTTKLGIMKMREVDALNIPKRQVFQLHPKGEHIMLMGLKRQLNVGDTLYLKLSNADGVGITVPVQVREAGDAPEAAAEGLKQMKETAQKKAAPKPEPVVEEKAPEEAAEPVEEAAEEAAEAIEEATEAEVPPAVTDDPAATEEKVEEAVEDAAEAAVEAAEEKAEDMVKEAAPAVEEPAMEKPAKKSLWEKLKW